MSMFEALPPRLQFVAVKVKPPFKSGAKLASMYALLWLVLVEGNWRQVGVRLYSV